MHYYRLVCFRLKTIPVEAPTEASREAPYKGLRTVAEGDNDRWEGFESLKTKIAAHRPRFSFQR